MSQFGASSPTFLCDCGY